MRKSALTIAAAGVAAVTLLAACSSSSKSGGTTTSSGSTSSGSSSSSSGGGSGKVEVGVILPDTTSSTRYTEFDAPLLTKAFNAAGIKADIQNAG
ncbi:MAG: sugar ABC transporter substrate-binding protein, partial [Actinobacteria bacterium]|nr:sugar ABC transporter substrate-binding protein [Actinomycetota bacterium]